MDRSVRSRTAVFAFLLVLTALLSAMCFSVDDAWASKADPNPGTHVGDAEGALPDTSIDYTDVTTGIRYLFEADVPDEGSATLRLIVLDNMKRDAANVVIPGSVTKDGKTYTVTAIGYNENWGRINDLPRARSNMNIFGEEIRYGSDPGTSDNTTYYPSTNLDSVSSISIPASINAIPGHCFKGCTGAKLVNIEEGSALKTIGMEAFRFCESAEKIVLPDSVEEIGNNAFDACASLTNFTIPVNVQKIGASALINCTSLQSVSIPSSLGELSTGLFQNDVSLETVDLPDNLTSIPNGLFSGCSSLKTVDIPSGVTSIGSAAFSDCAALTRIVLPPGVTQLSSGLFAGCTSLTLDNIVIEDKSAIASIGGGVFSGWTQLTSFPFEQFPNYTVINLHTFDDTNIRDFVVPSQITAAYAPFCSSDTVTIPASTYMNGVGSSYGLPSNQATSITVQGGTEAEPATFDFKALSFSPGYGTRVAESSLERIVFDGTYSEITGSAPLMANGNPSRQKVQFINSPNVKSIIFTGDTSQMSMNVEKNVFATAYSADTGYSLLNDLTFYGYAAADSNDPLVQWCADNGFAYKTLASVDNVTAKVDGDAYLYAGNNTQPTITVKDGDTDLVENVDYTVRYFDNDSCGTATARVIGLNQYSALFDTLTFNIVPNDKTALQGAVATAQADLDGTLVGEQQDTTLKWTSQEDADTLAAAIATAQAVVDDDNQTEAQISDAVDAVQLAQFRFDEAKQGGESIDYAPLISAVAAATADMDGVQVSADGSDVAVGAQWTSQEAVDTFNQAIAAATATASNAASQSDVSAAVQTLADAQAAFDASKADGTKDAVQALPMYRVYNPNSGEHFYTANAQERDNLVAVGWNDEGIGWYAPDSGAAVYRLYNSFAGDHHYTLSVDELASLVAAGWTYEGVGWCSAPADDEASVPLYRQYNPYAVTGAHNYTVSKDENDNLVTLGWQAEGIAWYGIQHS